MGINIRFLPYTAGLTEGVEIHRADKLNGERVKLASLPVGVHAYTDRTVELNKTYTYWVLNKSVEEGDRWSEPIVGAAYFDTGPGPQTLLRGDWDFGYMGFVPVAELFNYDDVQVAAGITVPPLTPELLTGYHKCALNNRIVYIGDSNYGAGLLRSETGNVLLPMDSDVTTAASRVSAQGYDFLIRCPFSSTDYTTENAHQDTPDATLKRSEVGMLASLILDASSNGALSDYKMGDTLNNLLSTFYFSNTYAQNNTVHVFNLAPAASIGPASDMSGSRPLWPVFELVFKD